MSPPRPSLPLGLQLGDLLLQGLDLRLLGVHLALVPALLVLHDLVGDAGAHGGHRHGEHGRPEEAHGRPQQRRPEHRRGEDGADADGDVGAAGEAGPRLRLLPLGPLRGRHAAHAAAHAAHAAPETRGLSPAEGHEGHEEGGAHRHGHAPSLARGARRRSALGGVRCLHGGRAVRSLLGHRAAARWQGRLHERQVHARQGRQERGARASQPGRNGRHAGELDRHRAWRLED
mmetsp:Transcript_29232/g.92358  ORF Transcript_29232/g.92358 Transcript_29232/m.92358 type:complete len:231 (+) Transcript_29232:237-929(+)